MRLTIRIPWFTYSRRLAVMVAAALLLISVALPASAAPPEGIEGNVVVVNDAENPVPVTGDITADVSGSVDVSGAVTVDNAATDPVPVTGSVNADVTGAVSVSGGVDINNEPTVDARQAGDWSLEVSNFPQDRELAGDARRFNLPAATPPDPANQLVVPEGTVLTDLVVSAAAGVDCLLTVWQGTVAGENIIYQVDLPQGGGTPVAFHLESGLPGTVIIGMGAPSGPGCMASLFWTGYEV